MVSETGNVVDGPIHVNASEYTNTFLENFVASIA